MLKISKVGKAHHSVILKLEGRVVGPWVGELRDVCQVILDDDRKLKLDLAEVSFVDADGLATLSSLKSRGLTIKNCSPFVEEQLKSSTAD